MPMPINARASTRRDDAYVERLASSADSMMVGEIFCIDGGADNGAR